MPFLPPNQQRQSTEGKVIFNNVKSQFNKTCLEMALNNTFSFKIFTTQTATELFNIRVYSLMTFQLIGCVETLWAFSANIWPYIFVSQQMFLKVIAVQEFPVTDMTREPTAFTV